MPPIITPEAAAILANPKNSYWAPRDKDTIRVDAIAFDDAYFLAGPFDEKYGLVYVDYKTNAKPLHEVLKLQYAGIVYACSTSYMPSSAVTKLGKLYPTGTAFYWNADLQKSYSDFDYPYLSAEVRQGLVVTENRCQLFAETAEGQAQMMGHLTADEQAQYLVEKRKIADSCEADFIGTGIYAERPYLVRLQGNDDSSWSANFMNEQDVDDLLKALRERGQDAVHELMHFTN